MKQMLDNKHTAAEAAADAQEQQETHLATGAAASVQRQPELQQPQRQPAARLARPELPRAAVTSGLVLLTALLLSQGASAAQPAANTHVAPGWRDRLTAMWEPDTTWQTAPPPLHPDCISGRPRPDGMHPAERGQCWRELAAHHELQQQQRARSLSGRLSSLLRVASVPLWEILSRPLEWWWQKPLHPLPQDVAAAARFTRDGSAQRQGGSSENDEGVPWTSFNDSAMAQTFSHDVAWMMEREEQQRRAGNQTHAELDIDVAVALAHVNSIVYCEVPNIQAWNCSRCNGAGAGFQLYALINDLGWDLRAFVGYAPVLGAKVVAFRGTDSHSWYNWAENMRAWRLDMHLPYPGAAGALVHSGFFVSYNFSSLSTNISEAAVDLEREYPGEPWYIIGHSMGAAMATLCALDLRFRLQPVPDVRVYTFGSPRVGNAVFATFFGSVIQESYRVTHNRDIVPSVPLQIMGFHHVAREVWVLTFDAGPTIIGLCDKSGEDPACHNSVCYLGLCTSIVDHMEYLGGHMYHRNPIGC